MRKTIFGLASNETQAHRVINALQNEGFDTDYISVIVFDKNNQLTRKNTRGELETNPEFFERTGGYKNKANGSTRRNGSVGVEKHTKAPEGATTGAVTGGIIGGTLGLLAGLGALAIPGFGPLVAAGPILAALSGSAIGGSTCLLIGALVGMGLPEYEAKKFQDRLKQGQILLSIDVEDADQADRAKEIMEENGAVDVSVVDQRTKARY